MAAILSVIVAVLVLTCGVRGDEPRDLGNEQDQMLHSIRDVITQLPSSITLLRSNDNIPTSVAPSTFSSLQTRLVS
jgi:hypothetical protein